MTLLGLYDYITKSGFKSVVLGSSGGVDSALVATLATLAIGKDNVNCIMMPSCYSSEGSVKDAKELHSRLGCKEFLVPIEHLSLTNHINKCFGFIEMEDIRKADSLLDVGYKQLVDYNKVADENIQARMRGQIVMHFSNATGALALTTGNKTELAVGYCTLYGDTNGGFNPIGDLYKMDVFGMCEQINTLFGDLIPDVIINKAPSAELKPNQTDEASLLPYPILDKICRLYIEEYVTDYTLYKIKTQGDTNVAVESDFNRITRLIYINEFKRRQVAPTIKLSKVAFGTGRRLPIVKK
jgi:NAD+ synthetase